MNDDLMAEFFTDTQSHLEAIEELILIIEKEGFASGAIDDMFRRVHSIKGNAGVLGLGPIHTEGMKFETFLDGIRERKAATADEMDQMFSGLDALREIVGRVREEKGMGHAPKREEPKRQAPQAPAATSASPVPPQSQPVSDTRVEVPEKPSSPIPQPAHEERERVSRVIHDEDLVTFLSFELDSELFGVEILKVREIILREIVTPVPNTKSFVQGVMNLRDQIIPVFDLRRRLGMGSGGNDEKNVVIIEIGKVTTGLLVDDVKGIVTIAGKDIAPPQQFHGSVPTDFLYGIGRTGEGTIVLLDALDLCDPEELLY
ncbi:MAG: chemotaxis protein CheW [Nitrospinae bacterium]|nr:chemotaxis protein CheW [Nitrospinota bacterium]